MDTETRYSCEDCPPRLYARLQQRIQNSELKTKNCKAFTLIEVLTAVTIIAILLGILMPALNMVRKTARDTQQKALLASIEVGINLYKNEDVFGDYPPAGKASTRTGSGTYYTASQMLAEAMFGQDLLGVDPCSDYTADNTAVYDSDPNNRKGPYLDRTHISVFTPEQIYTSLTGSIAQDDYLICDVYTVVKKNITLKGSSTTSTKRYNISTPILYYKAKSIGASSTTIYNHEDNQDLIDEGTVVGKKVHSLNTNTAFYSFIKDPMASTTTTARPVRPDSFLLISAGNDGVYGTADDICNFEPTLE